MAGAVIPIIAKREYDFAGDSTVVAVKTVDVSRFSEGAVLVRVHANSVGSGSSIKVAATGTSPSAEDPDTDFLETTAAATVSVSSSSTAPTLLRTALAADFAARLRITVEGIKGAGACRATISADLVMKE